MPKKRKYSIRYQNIYVKVPLDAPPKEGICSACQRQVGNEIKNTHLHHWKYAYKNPTVKKTPSLAMDFTSELCFGCHKIGDALRTILTRKAENVGMILDTAEQMPEDMKTKLDRICKGWLLRREGKKEKVEIDDYF